MLAKKLPPGLRTVAPTTPQGELDLLTTSWPYLVWSTMRNNPEAVAANLGEARRSAWDSRALTELYDQVRMLDAEEQAAVLDVHWNWGLDTVQDEAYNQAMTMAQETGAAGGLKLAPLAIAGIMAAVSAVAGAHGQQQANEAAARVAAAEAAARSQAAIAAQEAAAKRAALVRKWWPVAVAVLAILSILIIRKA